jgi:hypothetical protein
MTTHSRLPQRFAGRPKILSEVCALVWDIQDLERTSKPLVKLAVEELLRAHMLHRLVHADYDEAG